MEFGIFDLIIILLAATVVMAALFHRIYVPPILGYLLIGMLCGPFALGWVPDTQITQEVAEFGVVFLMFTIGLEFSWARIVTMWRSVFLLGGLSVGFALLATMLIGYAFDLTFTESFLIGGIVAMSSTAIVSKQLSEQNELVSSHGMRALGITLFEDLFAIPFLILIPALAQSAHPSFEWIMLIAVAKAIAVIAVIILGGRWILCPAFYLIARTRSVELFTLTALLVTLGTAWITHKFGLSMGLGAFLAGILLGETEFRHQIEVDIRPFRDVLLGLFFVSIGMDFDLKILNQSWKPLLLLLSILIVVKLILITTIGLITRAKLKSAFRTALILAHGGEFGFVILTLTLDYKLVSQHDGEIILGAIFLSMVLAPFLIRYNRKIAKFLFPKKLADSDESLLENMEHSVTNFKHHVIICGFGRVGQYISSTLKEFKIPYVALDLDAPRVEQAIQEGETIAYGDATQRDILLATGLLQADAVIVTFNNPEAACHVIRTIRYYSEKIPVIIRTSDASESQLYYELGATAVIPEVLESSLSMAMNLLLILKQPIGKVSSVMNQIRRDQYEHSDSECASSESKLRGE